MTPEQKAKELVDKFYNSLNDEGCQYKDSDCSIDWDETRNAAKVLALIAVDTTIGAIGDMEDPTMFISGEWTDAGDFWQSVNKEIQKA